MSLTRSSVRKAGVFQTAAVVAVLAATCTLSGCKSDAGSGLLVGAGIGALAGQAIGGNTQSTLIGTGVGAGVGHVIGNERDRAQARQISDRQSREIAELRADRDRDAAAAPVRRPAASPQPPVRTTEQLQTAPLEGTRWSMVNLSPRTATEPFLSMIIDFQSGGRLVTMTTREDGAVDVYNERYRVVGDTLIINRDDYLINARFSISTDELVVSADRFSAVLRRLP